MGDNGSGAGTVVIDVPVLIVGAGPTGLCASIGLSRHGIRSLTVEKHPGTTIYPRAIGVNTRSMEILRSFGLEERVRAASFDAIPQVARSQTLLDPEPELSPSLRGDRPEISPTRWTTCSQYDLEPILLEHARSHPCARVMFGTELLGFSDGPRGVIARLGDRSTGRVREVRCRYVIAADGARSAIRGHLGVEMQGPGRLGENVNLHVRAPLGDVLRRTPHFLHRVAGEGGSGTLVAAIDGHSRWVFVVGYDPACGESPADFTPDRVTRLVRSAIGNREVDVETIAALPWTAQADVATQWRAGHIFLAGDAAHRMTPAGALGMNSGIQDVHNLSWKLAAVLHGGAGEGLLDTYEVERRPVAEANVARSVALLITDFAAGGPRTAIDYDLGFRYASPAVFDDGREPEGRSDGDCRPTAAPGCRAPHVWLDGAAQTISLLDVFADGFTFLTATEESSWYDVSLAVAAEHGMPLKVVVIPRRAREEWMRLYGVGRDGAVLVRPDGHVAWRQKSLSAVAMRCLETAASAVLGVRTTTPLPLSN